MKGEQKPSRKLATKKVELETRYTIDVLMEILAGLKVKDFVVPHIQNSFVGLIGIGMGREVEDTRE